MKKNNINFLWNILFIQINKVFCFLKKNYEKEFNLDIYGGDCPKRNYFKDENGSIENTYGPRPNFKINTLKEFRPFLTQKFDKDMYVEEMTITLKQNGNEISVSSRSKAYMVLVPMSSKICPFCQMTCYTTNTRQRRKKKFDFLFLFNVKCVF